MNTERLLDNYKNVMRNHLNNAQFELLLKNIASVSFNHSDKKDDNIISVEGDYDPEGIVTLYSDSEELTFYHEMLHASSTYYNKEKQERFSGFHHQKINERINIGLGFNEGYTQLLTEKYFNKGVPTNSYQNEVLYVKLIEQLIGEDKLKDSYFTSNLDMLISELSKYNLVEEVYQFLENLDLFIILKEIMNEKENESNIPTLESIKYSQEIDEKILDTYKNLDNFIMTSFESKYLNDSDYKIRIDNIKDELMQTRTFMFRKYDLKDEYNNKSIERR